MMRYSYIHGRQEGWNMVAHMTYQFSELRHASWQLTANLQGAIADAQAMASKRDGEITRLR